MSWIIGHVKRGWWEKELRVCYIIESSPLINIPLSSLRWLAKPETLSCSWGGGRARHVPWIFVSKARGLVWFGWSHISSSPLLSSPLLSKRSLIIQVDTFSVMLFTIHITPVCGSVAMILLLELSLSPYLSCVSWDNRCRDNLFGHFCSVQVF
jgi:hypothetical protein